MLLAVSVAVPESKSIFAFNCSSAVDFIASAATLFLILNLSCALASFSVSAAASLVSFDNILTVPTNIPPADAVCKN